jgi:hypothetical protein
VQSMDGSIYRSTVVFAASRSSMTQMFHSEVRMRSSKMFDARVFYIGLPCARLYLKNG